MHNFQFYKPIDWLKDMDKIELDRYIASEHDHVAKGYKIVRFMIYYILYISQIG